MSHKPTPDAESSSSETSGERATAGEKETPKNKKCSSRASRALRELDHGLTRSARRVITALDEGLLTYDAAREATAARKRDGALDDLIRDQSRALRKALPIAALATSDLLDAVAEMRFVRDWTDKGDEEEDEDEEKD